MNNSGQFIAECYLYKTTKHDGMNYHLPPLDEEELNKMVDAWNHYFDAIRKMVRNEGGTEEEASDVFMEAYAPLRAAEIAGEFTVRDEAFSARLYQLATRIWKDKHV